MDGALWIAAITLAIGLGVSGLVKAITGREKLMANPRMAWVEDFSDPAIRTIGGLEFLGALGLILPAVTGIAPILVPLAAVGLAITMFGAIVVHVRRGDGTLSVVVPLVLGLTAIFVAWGRFGSYAF
jgi:hypothetical protein